MSHRCSTVQSSTIVAAPIPPGENILPSTNSQSASVWNFERTKTQRRGSKPACRTDATANSLYDQISPRNSTIEWVDILKGNSYVGAWWCIMRRSTLSSSEGLSILAMVEKFTWEKFAEEQGDVKDAFETLSRRILAHDIGITSWQLNCSATWPGVECDPELVDGKHQSFQAKFYSDAVNGWKKLKDSLNTAGEQVKLGHYKLDVCHVFVTWDKPVKKKGRSANAKTKEEECDEIAEASGFTIRWNYSSQILERLSQDDDPAIRKLARQFFIFPLQPNLERPQETDAPQGFRRLKFSERLTDFVGRKKEMQQLADFVDDEEEFRWWLMIGPAFSGKSRLTLEYCQALPDDWQWGWISTYEMESFPFSQWKPDRCTFIVIDYAMGKESTIERVLQQVRTACMSNQLLHKVRVLLVEREYTDWLRRLNHLETIGNWIESKRFSPSALVIARLSSLANQSHARNETVAEQINALLCNSHSDKDITETVRSLVDREKEGRWGNLTQGIIDTILVATMCGGFDATKVRAPTGEVGQYLRDLNGCKDLSRIIGVQHVPHQYPAMDPDMFGELFVLDELANRIPASNAHHSLFKLASRIDPSGFVNFWYRCGQSYSTHSELNRVLEDWPADATSKSVQQAIIANGIENPNLSIDDCIARYQIVLRSFEPPNPNFLFVEKILFSKLLARCP